MEHVHSQCAGVPLSEKGVHHSRSATGVDPATAESRSVSGSLACQLGCKSSSPVRGSCYLLCTEGTSRGDLAAPRIRRVCSLTDYVRAQKQDDDQRNHGDRKGGQAPENLAAVRFDGSGRHVSAEARAQYRWGCSGAEVGAALRNHSRRLLLRESLWMRYGVHFQYLNTKL
jgi:hypothetical protein